MRYDGDLARARVAIRQALGWLESDGCRANMNRAKCITKAVQILREASRK